MIDAVHNVAIEQIPLTALEPSRPDPRSAEAAGTGGARSLESSRLPPACLR
jgi:hypothetical protein